MISSGAVTRPRRAVHTAPWLAAFWLVATAGLRPLILPDEGRYVGVALEMLRSGDWLTPTLNGLPFFHKPPLAYWITAAAMSLGGVNAFMARAAPMAGALLALGALWHFTLKHAGEAQARRTVVVLATVPLFFGAAQFANLDMLVAGCITATLLAAADAVLSMEDGRPHRAALVAAYGCAALGVLAKGLIGAVLPALVTLLWLLAIGRPRRLLHLISVPGLAVFALVAVPWFVLMQRAHPAFFDYFFVYQQATRFLHGGVAGGFSNAEPAPFFFVVLPVLALPWSAWLAAWRPAVPLHPRRPLQWLMWIWLAVIVVFFSLPASKLVGYVLPAVPPLAWLVADSIERRLPRAQGLVNASVAVAGAVCVALVAALVLRPPHDSRPVAAALDAQRAPGEPVLYVDAYYYDLPFYSRLRAPVPVVEDWSSEHVTQHDNWRRELADAARFATPASRAVLVERGALGAWLCEAARTWIVAPPDAVARTPVLATAEAVARDSQAVLYRVERGNPALHCGSEPAPRNAQ